MTLRYTSLPIVQITSSDEHNTQFGTGFIGGYANGISYVVTCAHVVRDVGGEAHLLVNGIPATVATSGEAQGLDLAVLAISRSAEQEPLSFHPTVREGAKCRIIGFQVFNKQLLLRPLLGLCAKRVEIAIRNSSSRITAWDLTIEDEFSVKPGYSGAPVIDDQTGAVVAVASHALSEGKQALAISIDNLSHLPSCPINFSSSQNASAGSTRHFTIPGSEITPETPLLIGALIDVSAALMEVVTRSSSRSGLLRERVTKALIGLKDEALQFCKTSHAGEILPKVSFFAYAYGFGEKTRALLNIARRIGLSSTRTDDVPATPVRDLFERVASKQGKPSTLAARDLSDNWNLYEQGIFDQMLDVAAGPPALADALQIVYARLFNELKNPYFESPLLFLVSSGISKEGQADRIIETCRGIRDLGVQIVSCYVGPKNIMPPKQLFASVQEQWPSEAVALYYCASRVKNSSPRANELLSLASEAGWVIPNEASLFFQLNQTKMLREFTRILLNSR